MRLRLAVLFAVSLAVSPNARAADPLQSYAADPAQVSVAGVSAGAFMANQIHVAHSAELMGAALIAGGLYGCAVAEVEDDGVAALLSQATGACMSDPNLLLPTSAFGDFSAATCASKVSRSTSVACVPSIWDERTASFRTNA